MTDDFELIRRAILGRRRIVATYRGHFREMCPYIIGHRAGEERALVLQVGGTSRSGLPEGGAWRCLRVAELTGLAVSLGPWEWAADFSAENKNCVAEIDTVIA